MTLTNNNIRPTDIIQLSGHKNLLSVTNYSAISQQQQQMKMSNALSSLATEAKEASSSKIVIIEEIDECKRTRKVQMHPHNNKLYVFILGSFYSKCNYKHFFKYCQPVSNSETEESSKRYKIDSE